MTPTTLLISGCLTIFGTLLGVALGLFGERYLRGRGSLRCSLVRREDSWYQHGVGHLDPAVHSVDQVEDFKDYVVNIAYELAFFNEKEIDHGLSNVMVVFVADGDEERVGALTAQEGLETVNLAARKWSTTTITGQIDGPRSRLVRDWRTIEVRGIFPDHSPFKQAIMKRVSKTIPVGPLFGIPDAQEGAQRPWWRRMFGS
jgi:hypothetical protein